MISIRYVLVYDANRKIIGRFNNHETAHKFLRTREDRLDLRVQTKLITINEWEDLDTWTEYSIMFFPNEGGKHPKKSTYKGKKRHPAVDVSIMNNYVVFRSSESMEHCEQLLRENIAKALHWVNVVSRTPLSFKGGVSVESIINSYEWNLD